MQTEELINTGEVNKTTVPNGVVYGESHVYRVDITQLPNWSEVKQRARSSDVVILEHPTDPDHNIWTTTATFTYMRAAELNAKLERKEVHYLDPTVGTDSQKKLEIYRQQGVQADLKTIVFIEALKLSLLVTPDTNWHYNMQRLIGNIAEGLDAPIQDRIITAILNVYTNSELQPLIKSAIALDRQVRERAFQENLSTVLDAIGDKSYMVMVGNSHFNGVVRTCNNPGFRTEISTDEFTKLFDFIASI